MAHARCFGGILRRGGTREAGFLSTALSGCKALSALIGRARRGIVMYMSASAVIKHDCVVV